MSDGRDIISFFVRHHLISRHQAVLPSGVVVEVGISIILGAAQTKAQEQEMDDRHSFNLPRTTANTKQRYR
jgi:hypothetical protein